MCTCLYVCVCVCAPARAHTHTYTHTHTHTCTGKQTHTRARAPSHEVNRRNVPSHSAPFHTKLSYRMYGRARTHTHVGSFTSSYMGARTHITTYACAHAISLIHALGLIHNYSPLPSHSPHTQTFDSAIADYSTTVMKARRGPVPMANTQDVHSC